MKQENQSVRLSEKAISIIANLRANREEGFNIQKSELADSFGIVANLIQEARDMPELSAHVDGLLSVLNTLSSYNCLLNVLIDESKDVE